LAKDKEKEDKKDEKKNEKVGFVVIFASAKSCQCTLDPS